MEDFESLSECDGEIKEPLSLSLTEVTQMDGPSSIGEGARAGESGARRSGGRSRAPRESNLSKPKKRREKPFSCNVCKKSCRKRSDLDSHMLSHLRIKSYECHACGKIFDSKRVLRQHSCSALDEPYQFTLLKQGYSKKGNLVTIADTKPGVKYRCAVCEKACVNKTALKLHVRTHTGEKPYQCYVCDKGFAVRNHLKVHMRIHTDEKPYNCGLCDKSFRKSDHLNRHMLVHTRAKLHHCTVCGKNFSRKSYLATHMRLHDRDNP